MTKLPEVTISDLLDGGVHFGHKISRWNPKMAPYLYGVKDGIHVIDLQQTVPLMKSAIKKIHETIKNNGKILFVGTKIQAGPIVAEYAEHCGQYYVNHRWLGGMLTNWNTISRSIKKLDQLEKILNNQEQAETYTKKELLDIERKKDKLLCSLGGIRNMGTRPDLIIIIDTNKEHLAIQEARRLNIPIIAIVDSNSNPDNIDYPIPGNDDAIRSIKLYCSLFADTVLMGIEDSLAASGVDLGAVAGGEDNSKAAKKVAAIKSNKAVATDAVTKPAKKAVAKTKVTEDVATKAKPKAKASSANEGNVE